MANSLLTTSLILDRAMAVLFQEPTFLDKINTSYDGKFAGKGAKVGDTVSVRVPQRAVIRDGRVMNIQNQVDVTVPVTISKYKGVDTGATSLEMALDIDDYQEQFIDTKIPDLVAAIESDVLSTVLPLVPQTAGDYGLLNDVSTILAAGGLLDNSLAPQNGRNILASVSGRQQIVNALTGFYNPQPTISEQFKSGLMARNTLGFDWYSSSLVPSITRGTANGSYVLNGVPANGATTAVVATGTGTLAAGDTFTLAGVYDVHPQTKASLGYLKQFVVTAAYAGGAGTISFSPALNYTAGATQNVSAAPASNAAITVAGSSGIVYSQSVAFAKDAFYFVTADLPMPKGMGVECAQKTWKGITMRFMNGFDIANDMFVSRFDVAYGAGVLRPELAVRLPHILA